MKRTNDTHTGTPSPRWGFMLPFLVQKDGSNYLFRLRLIQTPWFGAYLHWIMRPDQDRDPHDHPWNFWSIILNGSYREVVYTDSLAEGGTYTRWSRFSVHRMKTNQAHKITEITEPLVTLVLVGRRQRDWGFWTEDGFVPWRDYIAAGEEMV